MLKDNVISTLFDHNKDKQPIKKEVHCQSMKLHTKISTVRKHLTSMTNFRNLNTKLITKKSRRPQRPEISRHKQTSLIKRNTFSVISKRILKFTLVNMK